MCRRRTFDVDFSQQALDAIGLDQTGPEVLRGLGAAGDPEGQRVLDRAVLITGGDEPREEGVTGPDRRPRLDRAPAYTHAQDLRLARIRGEDPREAPVGHRHDRL